jgi:hypothetical protein
MAELLASAAWGRWRPGARFLIHVARRTLAESVYLLTAPVTAAAGLLLVSGSVCVAAVSALVPGGSPAARILAPARCCAGLERWRIAAMRSMAGVPGAGARARPEEAAHASVRVLWPDVAHAVVVFPVALVTALVTGLWWSLGLAIVTFRCATSTRSPHRRGL